MAVVVRGTVPAEEFALHHALGTLEDGEFDTERVVESGDEVVMPLMWVRGTDRENLEGAFESDSTVRDVSLLATFDRSFLYRMEWIENTRLILQMITNSEATVLDAYGREQTWHLRVLYPSREQFSRTHEFCHDHGLSFDIDSIREIESEPSGRYGLTDGQHRALELAARRGYFEVPRSASLEELADELDISHQALSERLRRGTEALVDETILIGPHERDRDD